MPYNYRLFLSLCICLSCPIVIIIVIVIIIIIITIIIGIVAQPELNGKLMVVKELPTPDRASYLVAPIGSEHDPTTAATAPSPSQTQSVYGMKVEKLMLVVPVQERIDGQGSGGSDMHKYGS